MFLVVTYPHLVCIFFSVMFYKFQLKKLQNLILETYMKTKEYTIPYKVKKKITVFFILSKIIRHEKKKKNIPIMRQKSIN